MNFLYKESESKKKYMFFIGRVWARGGEGGEGRRLGARVSECFTRIKI